MVPTTCANGGEKTAYFFLKENNECQSSNVDNVIGEQMETEDKILIPVVRMGAGFGAGDVL